MLRDHELVLPIGSILVPGVARFAQGDVAGAAAFAVPTAVGYALFLGQSLGGEIPDPLSRDGSDQLAIYGAQLAQDAGFLSAYDSFHRSLGDLRKAGRYAFLTDHEPTLRLLGAPAAVGFLKRGTTLIPLAAVAAAGAVALADRPESGRQPPLRAREALYTLGISFNAGVTEEAVFRGYLLPMLTQSWGSRFHLANTTQALLFGSAHYSKENGMSAVIGASAFGLYAGWLTRRNAWSVREAAFIHFWWDVIALPVALLTQEESARRIRVRFPAVSF
jgi:membrane protease YdiL (CAAX protease family)